MVTTRYCRSAVESRSLACPLPFDMLSQEAKRYRAWQRMARRLQRLDSCVMLLRMAIIRRYNAELTEINRDDGPDRPEDGKAAYTRRSGGPYRVNPHFEAERWRRS